MHQSNIMVREKTLGGEQYQDLHSRLLKDRKIFLLGEVNDESSHTIVTQLLYLANDHPEKEITMYINSPGGSVTAALAMYDIMQHIPNSVATVCLGLAASAGALLLCSGTKGHRRSFPNSRIMIHQPSSGCWGQASDLEIQVKETLILKDVLNKIMAKHTGKDLSTIIKDMDRDNYMSARQAQEYGIIDKVVQ